MLQLDPFRGAVLDVLDGDWDANWIHAGIVPLSPDEREWATAEVASMCASRARGRVHARACAGEPP